MRSTVNRKTVIRLSEYEMQQINKLKEVTLVSYGLDFNSNELINLIVRGMLINPENILKVITEKNHS